MPGEIEYQTVVDADGNVVGRVPLRFGTVEDGDNRRVMPLPPPDEGQLISLGLMKARPRSDHSHRRAFYLWGLFHAVGPIVVAIGLLVVVIYLLRIGAFM